MRATTPDPPLENAPGRVWTEKPLLVSGASAYSDGEFLDQGWLSDDQGAAGTLDPTDPFCFVHPSVATKTGTLTYPTDPRLAGNAADLVAFRLRALLLAPRPSGSPSTTGRARACRWR